MITKLSSILMPPFYLHGFSSCVYCLRHENGRITAHLALNTNRTISINPEITLQNYRKQLDIYDFNLYFIDGNLKTLYFRNYCEIKDHLPLHKYHESDVELNMILFIVMIWLSNCLEISTTM